MVIRRFFTAAVCLGSIVMTAGCYEDNCEMRLTCPVLDDTGTATSEPLPDEEPASTTTTTSTTSSTTSTTTSTTTTSSTSTSTTTPTEVEECTFDDNDIPDNGCGVFASASFGDDDNPGTRLLPVRTLKRGLQIAVVEKLDLFACAESFYEDIAVPSGINLIGGLDCHHDWQPVGQIDKTEIIAKPGQIPLTLLGSFAFSRVENIRAVAVDAIEPGGSSIAALVQDKAIVELSGCELIAGKGAAGSDGAPGSVAQPVAKGGVHGHAGASACSTDIPEGGAFVSNLCDDGVVSIGGFGGFGGPTSGSSGADGTPFPSLDPDGYGAAGAGASSAAGDAASCMAGSDGADGHRGHSGWGGFGPGQLSAFGYFGRNGEHGGNGLPGQGGGGGGGARGGALFCGAQPSGGAAGGSGGSGGCGGRGGRGGNYGGASIGLAITSASVHVMQSAILTADGGDGGTGGMYQLGGAGGFEGQGGLGFGGSKTGCAGGNGGFGGDGGNGGGGLGGPSTGIAHRDVLPVIDNVTIKFGKGGKGGLGGNPNVPEAQGENGGAAESLIMPTDS